tara:strand:- start:1550 stop:1804 length:255 start_codon:yes stop_codon:yes gene_type:complete
MCIFGRPASPPPPPPLPPAPPPPAPPAPPLPTPEPLVSEVDPKVRRTKSRKAKNTQAQGTGNLRIPLKSNVNTTGSTPQGGLNK